MKNPLNFSVLTQEEYRMLLGRGWTPPFGVRLILMGVFHRFGYCVCPELKMFVGKCYLEDNEYGKYMEEWLRQNRITSRFVGLLLTLIFGVCAGVWALCTKFGF